MTERMKEIKHFAHEHPLIFNDSEEIPFCCDACGLRVLSSPSYICTVQGCSFYLHEPCTRLPDTLSHRVWNKKHDLRLSAKPLYENCSCSKCGTICKNFTYHCNKCDKYYLDPLCGYPLDIQIKYISHPQHPLVAICQESLLLCHVCGRKHNGFFFICHQCNYWIHQDCASLPSFLRVGCHPHYLSLTYSGTLSVTHRRYSICIICKEETSPSFGAYTCTTTFCRRIAHVDCAVSMLIENPDRIHHLPAQDDTFWSSIIPTVLEENTTPESNGETMLEKYHTTHSFLILNNEPAHQSVCNACIRPIAPPYYSGSQSACNFFIHKFCADLPLVINDLFDKSRHLVFPRCNELFSLFYCQLCTQPCNGFGYSSDYSTEPDVLHLECALAPKIIKHDSHKQHPLILGGDKWSEEVISCCDKINPSSYDDYICTQCRFCIHIRCALLPKTVTHKFDKHPLTLITDSSAQDLGDDHFCEFCEEDINPHYWFYRCIECDNSFHVDCIPSTGQYSRIKFGGTVVLPCHGDHPLTLVRMLSVGSQTCGFCYKIIEGFKDGMALQCVECDFWIHFKCGLESSDTKVSTPYQNIYLSDRIHQLPAAALDNTFWSPMIRIIRKENTTTESNGEAMLEKYHAHSLILNNETADQSACNACIQPIAPPYYSCSQSACNFFLHKFCTDLPLVINDLFDESRHLVFPRCNEFFSLFYCHLCTRLCNGFGYSSDYSTEADVWHLECALAPKIIKHDSHKQHPLILGGLWFENITFCCGKINPFCYDEYSCTQCGFCIHIRCSLLPKTVTHKFDKHPLTLITDSSAQDLGDDHFCEVCEKEINPSYWFYHCMECDNSFHVDCIPSTGQYSRIKFGGTVVLPCHGDHPLTLVRMLSFGSHTCGFCHETIEGLKDGMALHCAECDFWIHYKCGWESSDATVSSPYQDISSLLDRFSRYKSEFFQHF